MAGKKVKSEIETIRNELRSLSEAVWALRDRVTFEAAAAAATNGSGGKHHDDVAADLEAGAGSRGVVASRGMVRDADGGREYRWEVETPVENLLSVEDEASVRILAAIGHQQRLAILTFVLATPSTAADLVTNLNLGTTGAAYHHLNVLLAAGLVTQETRGVYTVASDRVGTILSIIAALGNMTSSVASPAGDVPGEAPEPVKTGKEASPRGKGRGRKAA